MEEDFNAAITVLENKFIVALPAEMTNENILNIEKVITEKAYQTGINGAILNFSMVTVMDTYTYQAFERITSVFALMGIQTIWVGLRPGVVFGLIELNVAINAKIKMAINLENGLALLSESK